VLYTWSTQLKIILPGAKLEILIVVVLVKKFAASYRTWKFNLCTQKTPPPPQCLILSQLTLVHTLASCLFKIRLSVVVSSVTGAFFFSVDWQIFCTHFSSSQVRLHANLAQLECFAMVVNYQVTTCVIVSILLVGSLCSVQIFLSMLCCVTHTTFRTDVHYHLSLTLIKFAWKRNVDGQTRPSR
jgi:hypothetical protein